MSTLREYVATFIFDTSKWDQPFEDLIEQVKSTITEIGAEIVKVDNLGIKSFARCPRKSFVAAPYVSITCQAPATFNALLQQRMRLNAHVKQVMVLK